MPSYLQQSARVSPCFVTVWLCYVALGLLKIEASVHQGRVFINSYWSDMYSATFTGEGVYVILICD